MNVKIRITIIDVILAWAELAKNSKTTQYADDGSTFSVRYREFICDGKPIAPEILRAILHELQEANCFESWVHDPYKPAHLAEFVVHKIDTATLDEYKNRLGQEPTKKHVMHFPLYKSGSIVISNKTILLPVDTNEDELCKIIFGSENSSKKLWDCDQILEKWGEINPQRDAWRKVYGAARRVSDKVAKETGIKDLITIKTKVIKVNPAYLPSN